MKFHRQSIPAEIFCRLWTGRSGRVTNMSGGPVLVPPGESLFVVDTAANLEALTPLQLTDLGTAVDTANADGSNCGTSAVMWIAAIDAPAHFTPDQVNARDQGSHQRIDYRAGRMRRDSRIFHIELDTHDLIIAEGALSESFLDDDSRGMIHNAHEFHALYPGAAARVGHYCAPRLDAGYEVEAVRRTIAQRAGLLSASTASPGDLRRSLDGERLVAPPHRSSAMRLG